jgi:hypothetical protein
MEMFCFGIFAGMIIAVIFIAGGAVYASRDSQRTNDVDSDCRVYVPSRNRDRGGDQSDYLGLDDEAVKGILYVMRMSVRYSEVERLAIDYCLDRLEAENG